MPSRLLAQLDRRVIVLDGAMGTAIHEIDLDVERDYLGCENCPEILLASRPEIIQGVHESFFEVGADAIETDSFGGARHVLAEFDLQNRTFELNKLAAEVGRAAADKHASADSPRFVLGSMGPGTKLLTLGQISWPEMLASYREQARGLIAGGADALLIETCQDILQVKCAVNACLAALDDAGKSHEDIPIMVSITIETTGTMLLGASIETAVALLRAYPIASLGLNCATGPVEMTEHIQYLSRHWDRYISVVPNAGLPVLLEGRTHFPLGPDSLTESLGKFIDLLGINIIGGCCGTTPEHIGKLASAVRDISPTARTPELLPQAATSLYSPTEFRQDSSFLIVGERMNASGSRKFKQLLESEDWDGVIALARSQMREGSHVLDLNVDYAGRDNAADIAEIVSRVTQQVDAPLMIDSTQIKTMVAALERAPGKCVINSANFEDGEEKFDEICRLARVHGAALVIGSIDEDEESAMARTADRKLEIAQRAHQRATEVHGLAASDLFFDPLVLPVSTGMETDRRSGLETIEGTRRIAQVMPECQLTAGVSNVSFGLKAAARVVLNSVFLHELVEAGLTSAIVHASKILPLNRIPDDQQRAAMDLLYDRRHESAGGTGLPEGVTDPDFDPLQAFIDLFKDVQSAAAAVETKKDLTLEERLRAHIVDGDKEGLDTSLDEAMETYPPLDIINDHLLDGMKTVGELFASGQMQLPFVLQSAQVMKAAVAHLEPHMEKSGGKPRGSIVLATVKGDVHDIGKNLVDIILSNNGYEVHNIGIKQPLSNILEKWQETGADAIGLSGLLVKSVHVMEENLRELRAQGHDVPVILGGAALSRHYAEDHLRTVYEGPLYYGKDAFEGLRFMDMLAGDKLAQLDTEIDARLTKRADAEKTIEASRARKASAEKSAGGGATTATQPARSDVATDIDVPTPPFWGSRVVEGLDLDEIYPYINRVALFRGQWQFKKGSLSDEEYAAKLEDTVEPVFARLKASLRDEGVLAPAAVYGYWPCASEGDDLIVYDPTGLDSTGRNAASPSSLRSADLPELLRFQFPRQEGKKRLCIADFFRSVESGTADVLALHCVTMGRAVSERAKELFEGGDYTEYLYTHGMGVETAEALAELWHKRIRQELGIGGDDSPRIKELFTQKYRGSRYSPGYPACPDMSDQDKIWTLLEPGRIGCELTENWQIDPEQSTSAFVVHHPEAKYFNV